MSYEPKSWQRSGRRLGWSWRLLPVLLGLPRVLGAGNCSRGRRWWW